MHLHLETDIAAPADTVWQLLGTEFADIANWSTFVKSSRAISLDEVPDTMTVAPSAPVPGRETTTKATLKEILTDYSDEYRSLTFLGDGLPPIVSRAQNVQSVRDNGEGSSTVVFEVDFDFKGPFTVLSPIMRKRMTRTFGAVQADLRDHAEGAA